MVVVSFLLFLFFGSFGSFLNGCVRLGAGNAGDLLEGLRNRFFFLSSAAGDGGGGGK